MNTKALAALLALLLGSSCGDQPGELVVIDRREPRTLIREGSAITESEVARRKTADEESARDTKAKQELFRAQNRLAGARNAVQRVDALGKLGRLGAVAEGALPAIEACLGDDDVDVRIAALQTRLAVRDEGGDALVLRALEDDEGEVRRAAVELWAARQPGQTGPLLKALHDDDPGVQYAAMTALGAGASISDEMIEEIAARLEDMSGSVAKVAFGLLLARRDRVRDFDAAIAVLLDHQDQTVRLSVIDRSIAAGLFSRKLAAKIVQTVVEDPEASVRGGAYRWLRELAPTPPPEFDVAADDSARWEGRAALLAWLEALPN